MPPRKEDGRAGSQKRRRSGKTATREATNVAVQEKTAAGKVKSRFCASTGLGAASMSGVEVFGAHGWYDCHRHHTNAGEDDADRP